MAPLEQLTRGSVTALSEILGAGFAVFFFTSHSNT